MKSLLELFSGTASISKVFRSHGWKCTTIDNDLELEPDILMELSEINQELWDLILLADVVWMSPPCQTFSMAAGNTHWTRDRQPKTEQAIQAKKLLKMCSFIGDYCIMKGKIFFIENPVARARWFLPEKWRKNVWYCKYGDSRAKPTDIWTNLNTWNPKTCKNYRYDKKGNIINRHCRHDPSRRGAKTGTQGLKGAKERGVIPKKLCEEIYKEIEG